METLGKNWENFGKVLGECGQIDVTMWNNFVELQGKCRGSNETSRTEQGHTRVPSISFYFDLCKIPS